MRKILLLLPLFLWTCGGGDSTGPTEEIDLCPKTSWPISISIPKNSSYTYTFPIEMPPSDEVHSFHFTWFANDYVSHQTACNTNTNLNCATFTFTPNTDFVGQTEYYFVLNTSAAAEAGQALSCGVDGDMTQSPPLSVGHNRRYSISINVVD